jgi:hypothetical protein
MTQIQARALASITPETIQCEGWDRPRELGCVAFDGDQITVGVWPDTEEPEDFDEFTLAASDVVEVTGS